MKRVEIAKSILSILDEDEKHGFKNIYTGDESWFYLSIHKVLNGFFKRKNY